MGVLECKVLGFVDKVTISGGMNSRPYGTQCVITHRAGHLALPTRFFTISLALPLRP